MELLVWTVGLSSWLMSMILLTVAVIICFRKT